MNLFQTTSSDVKVPNTFPSQTALYKIAIIGEAPGKDEVDQGQPFIGSSGRFLNVLLYKAGINRHSCFVGNVCQHQPPDNNINAFSKDGPEFREGFEQLRKDLAEFKPNICILLGKTALYAATLEERSMDDWRGTLFISNDPRSPMFGYKCISTYHPAAALRMYEYTQYILFDLIRACDESTTSTFTPPQRNSIIALSCSQIEQYFIDLKQAKRKVALDIEGGVQCLTCISFANCPSEALVIPFTRADGSRYWSFDDECRIWYLLDWFLGDPTVPKILQNYLYDAFVLAYRHKILIRGLADDTMLKWWELFSEMEKSLGVQASILTKEPFYKHERKSTDIETYWNYNGKDSMVTWECNEVMENGLRDDPTIGLYAKWHYRFNVALLAPLLYIELAGIKYNREKALTYKRKLEQKANVLRWYINKASGYPWPQDGSDRLLDFVRSICLTKKGDRPRKEFAHQYQGLYNMAMRPHLTCAERGKMQYDLGFGLNVDSPPQMQEWLYVKMGFDRQFKKERGRKTDKVSTDILSLLNIYKKNPHKTLRAVMKLGTIMTMMSTLDQLPDHDGRIRCAYNIVGTVTGRVSCYESPTGSGYNLQTVTKKLRFLFEADSPDDDFGNIDLSGADGWTVAAHCANLGDRTMLDDYYFGLKPARNTAIMYEKGPTSNQLQREQLKLLGKKISGDGWLYFSCKCVQHGTNYGMMDGTIVDIVVKNSYKFNEGNVIYIEPATAKQLRILYLIRYGTIQRWHSLTAGYIKSRGYLISASGHKRIILGRRDDANTVRELLSNEPQENTTFANNLALYRLWVDPENRIGNALIIKPRHQVHDAINVCWPKANREWACKKIHQYFDNELRIAGIPITIPFEGAYGPSWGQCKTPI